MKKIIIILIIGALSCELKAQVVKNRWMNYPAVKDRGLVVSEEFYQPIKTTPPALSGASDVAGYSFLNTTSGFYYISAGTGNWYIYPTQTWVQNQLGRFVAKTGDETVGGIKNFSGSIGIGLGVSETPGSYMLAVKGPVRAREIKVDGSANWPDYVFSPDYRIMPLKTIETYIKENRHLPEMPSAADVKTQGFELGDISAKLLKKVEELTLILIEKEKQINELEKRVSLIEKR